MYNNHALTDDTKPATGPNMKLAINGFPWQDFISDTSLTFGQFLDNSATAVKFHDISRFSKQAVTLFIGNTTLTLLCTGISFLFSTSAPIYLRLCGAVTDLTDGDTLLAMRSVLFDGSHCRTIVNINQQKPSNNKCSSTPPCNGQAFTKQQPATQRLHSSC